MTGESEKTLLANRYRVVRQLGQGGMGSVWLAEDIQLDGKLFAIKMLPSILVANKRAYNQLKTEALVAMKLTHPNIVTLRAFEENNGNSFLVMDYVDGVTLDDYLSEKGEFSEEETVKLLKPIAEALDYAHGEGVVHRDVKPANVMIRKDGRLFILDFGIAREIQETLTRVTGKMSSGTLLYMSPEQLNGDMPKPSQDVYSFAVMVYECLIGEPPFVRGQIEHQILNNLPPPLPKRISQRLSESVMRGLAKKAEDRPENCCKIFGSTPISNEGEEIRSQTQLAITAYKAEDYATAFLAAKKADKNNVEIQYLLGRCYRFGCGVDEDHDQAMSWYKKAAKQGNNDALFEIGELYIDKVTDIDNPEWHENEDDELKRIFDVALKCTDPRVKRVFANLYVICTYGPYRIDGFITNISESQSLELLRESADNSCCWAQYELAHRYEMGDGVIQSYAESLKWYCAVAERGTQAQYADAQTKLGEFYKRGLGVPKDYDEAIKWYCKAVESCDCGQNLYNLAQMYEIAKKFSEAVKWYRKLAERGFNEAQINLAHCYHYGKGVPQDYKESLKWYAEAAKQDNVQAQYNIGVIYEKGMGVEKNYNEAFKWFLKAAEQRNAQAQHRIGKFYYDGIGVAQNYSEAYKWLLRAAGHGILDAQKVLGIMYMDGQGVEKDYNKSVIWFRKAAEQGDEEAQYMLGVLNNKKESEKKKIDINFNPNHEKCSNPKCNVIVVTMAILALMVCIGIWSLYNMRAKARIRAAETVRIIAERQAEEDRKAREVVDTNEFIEAYNAEEYDKAVSLLNSVDSNNADVQFYIGKMYSHGQGVVKDESEAVKWYRKSAEQGFARAQNYLGRMYEGGRGVKKDDYEAVKWYRKAAEQGNAAAQCNLGAMYANGRGVKKDDYEAVKWYRKSADQGLAIAQCCLGVMYQNGCGVKKDDYEAMAWYSKAAEQGLDQAQYFIGVMHYQGNGGSKDFQKAAQWFIKAAEQGYMNAQAVLGPMYENGCGVSKDNYKAAKWYRKAAEQGHANAQCNLGYMYEVGRGVSKDEEESVKWYRKAAEQGHANAQCNLGYMYEEGRGVSKDEEEAVKWYRKAAGQGYERAKKRLRTINEKTKNSREIMLQSNDFQSTDY